MNGYKTPLDDLINPRLDLDITEPHEPTKLNPKQLERQWREIHQKSMRLENEIRELLDENSNASKGYRGKILKVLGVKLRTNPSVEKKRMSPRQIFKYCVTVVAFPSVFLFLAVFFGAKLNNIEVAFVGVMSLFTSLGVSAIFPKSRIPIIKALRVIGDVGAVSLAYAGFKAIGINSQGGVTIMMGLTIIFLLVKLIREL